MKNNLLKVWLIIRCNIYQHAWMALPMSMKFDYELFLFDLLETNEVLLQPKAPNGSQEVEKDSCIFQSLVDLFSSLPLAELVQQITMENSHGQSKNQRTQGIIKIV